MENTTNRAWDIHEIESLTENEASAMAERTETIKDHTAYFVNLPPYFNYSVLVFMNGHHIHYANDYELHHRDKTKAELTSLYINKLNSILFTEDELKAPLKTYEELENKRRYLHNYYGMRENGESIFHIHHNPMTDKEKAEHAEFERRIANMVYNPIAFAYMANKEFVDHHIELYNALCDREDELKNNYEYYVNAFVYEMCNHEYAINYQADYDTLSAFGNIEWKGDSLADYFDQLNFTETQRRAYKDARQKYYKMADENGWF